MLKESIEFIIVDVDNLADTHPARKLRQIDRGRYASISWIHEIAERFLFGRNLISQADNGSLVSESTNGSGSVTVTRVIRLVIFLCPNRTPLPHVKAKLLQ